MELYFETPPAARGAARKLGRQGKTTMRDSSKKQKNMREIERKRVGGAFQADGRNRKK